MATVMVTGGCGKIGERVCSGLLKKGNTVIAVDTKPSDYNEGKENYRFYQAAPSEKGKYLEVFDAENIDSVVHLACSCDNDFGHIIGDEELKISKACDKFLYKTAINQNVEKFLLMSTTQVYDMPESREPIREADDTKPFSNYGKMKLESEKAFISDVKKVKGMISAIMRVAPVYSMDFYDNLLSKITDPKDRTNFIYRSGDYGFHFCCIHNVADFVICFLRQADGDNYGGFYNVADRQLTQAAEIISFMKEHHRLGPILQRSEGSSVVGSFFKLRGGKEDRANYRYLDLSTILNNNMFDINKAARICPFRWNINNTK